jgi:hypothetical protein
MIDSSADMPKIWAKWVSTAPPMPTVPSWSAPALSIATCTPSGRRTVFQITNFDSDG